MKRYILIYSIILFSNYAFSQNINAIYIVGKWKVINVLTKTNDPMKKAVLKSFNGAFFEFKENTEFKLTSSIDSQFFSMIKSMTNKSKWKLYNNSNFIKIGSPSDGYNIMGILVKNIDGKTIFKLDEAELEFEMQKT